MKKSWMFLLIVSIILFVFILPIGGRPMITPDETRYAEVPREMIASGNYISPRLNGVRYFEKTPLAYWCTALSFKIFGQKPFALRLPCMLAMLGTAWIVFLLMSQSYEKKTAWFGAWIYATLPMSFLIATVALTDYIFTFAITLTLALYFLALRTTTWKKYFLLFLCGIFCGFAFLAKGFIALAIPVIVITPYLIWEKKWKLIFTTPWLPLAGALCAALPWCIAIHQQEPDFWHYFFVVEHLNRYFGGAKAQHPKSVFYFIPCVIVGIAPWVLMLPNLCKSWRHEVFKSPLLKFALCGTVMPLLFFSASSGKLPTYILPCFAFIAILITAGAEKFLLQEKKSLAIHLTFLVLGIGLFLCGIGLTVNILTGFPVVFFLKEDWHQIALLWIAIIGCIAIYLIGWRAQQPQKLAMFLTAMMLVVIVSNFIFPTSVQEFKAPVSFFDSVRKTLPADKEIMIVCCCRPFQDVCYGFKSNKVYMYESENEIEYGISYPEAKHQFLKKFADLKKAFAAHKKKGGYVVLVMYNDRVHHMVPALGQPLWLRKSHPGTDDGYTVGLF